jgi:uncharacterized protein YbaP (TraB family)
MRRFLALAAALFLTACYEADHQPPPPDPALWIAHGPHAAVVLFGSYHALPTRMEWEPRALKLAVADADELWFETPLDEQSSYQLALALGSHTQLPKGRKLWDRLTPTEATRLRQACARVGVPPDKLARLQPWAADFKLGGEAVFDATGATTAWGVERTLDAQADAHTQRKGFETTAEHAAVIIAAAPADQIAMLDATVDNILDGRTSEEGQGIREWRYGDIAAQTRDDLGDDGKLGPGMYRRLLTDRNHRFADAITRRLQRKGFVVAVVGAAHMVGPEGVPALLRARGIPVDGPLTH